MRNHATNSDHPDLPKFNDDILSLELDYTLRQYLDLQARMSAHVRQTSLFPTTPPEMPLWMLKSDLDFCLERYDAIIEEIRYRKENMI